MKVTQKELNDLENVTNLELVMKRFKLFFGKDKELGNVNFKCPSLENPLETEIINFSWCYEFFKENQERYPIFQQFKLALCILDHHRKKYDIKEDYKELTIHGRVILLNIAAKTEGLKEELLEEIASYATEGLKLEEVPFNGKHGVTVQQIFDAYIKASIIPYLKDQNSIIEEGEEVEIQSKEKDTQKIIEDNLLSNDKSDKSEETIQNLGDNITHNEEN
jgi:hypothetical protein